MECAKPEMVATYENKLNPVFCISKKQRRNVMAKKMVTVICFVIVMFMLSAQVDWSFRSSATGGTIRDDLDLITDPIELKFVEGVRLYTNLSNLTSQNEELFDNQSDNEFLLGISAENPFVSNLWTSFFMGFENDEFANAVGIDSDLDGFEDCFGNGNLMCENTSFFWNAQENDYDQRNFLSQEKTDVDTDDSFNFMLNNTYDLDNFIFGARFMMGKDVFTDTRSNSNLGTGTGLLFGANFNDPSFSHIQDQWDLINEEFDHQVSEKGNFSWENKNSFTNILLSGMLPDVKEMEIRGDVFLTFMNDVVTTDDNYSGYQNENWNAVNSEYEERYNETDSNYDIMEEKGSVFGLGASVRKTFDEQDERKNDGYWIAGFDLGFGSMDYEDSNTERFSSTDHVFDNQETYVNNVITEDDKGTNSIFNYEVFCNINIPLSRKAIFAIGGSINSNSENRETDFVHTENLMTDFELLDGVTDNNDWIMTETSGFSANRTFKQKISVFRAPVGLEYRIDKNEKWAVRFGTIFTKTCIVTNDDMNVTNTDIRTRTTEFGGDQDDDIVYPWGHDYVEDVTNEESTDRMSNTVFSYGVGFAPLKNLQVDLLGYLGNINNSLLDAEFYRNLRLSFTLKFF